MNNYGLYYIKHKAITEVGHCSLSKKYIELVGDYIECFQVEYWKRETMAGEKQTIGQERDQRRDPNVRRKAPVLLWSSEHKQLYDM